MTQLHELISLHTSARRPTVFRHFLSSVHVFCERPQANGLTAFPNKEVRLEFSDSKKNNLLRRL